jgi:hypothetical protein
MSCPALTEAQKSSRTKSILLCFFSVDDKPLGDIKKVLADLHPIISIPEQTSGPISLHDPTLRDFLLDQKRSADLDFGVSQKQAHKALAKHCIDIMSKALQRDTPTGQIPSVFA